MSITVSNGTGYIEVDYGTGRVETLRKGSFRTVVKGSYLYLVFDNVDNLFPKYTYPVNYGLMYDKIELLYTDVGTPSEASATALRDTILGWDGVEVLPTGAATAAKQLANDHDVTVSNMIPSVETGLATSAKQLADDHNVTVSNMISDVETGLAKDTTLTDASQKTQIVDDSGNNIDAEPDHLGKYHLAVTANQDVNVSAGNASNVNLASGATWAGTPVSTLGVVGLQWNLNTDQNCTLYSEESEGSHTGIGTVATNGTTTLTGTSTTFERSFVVGDTISVAGETDRIIAAIASDTSLTVTVAFSTTDSGLAYTHYHWDISYPFDFLYKEGIRGEGETVQATMAYWRLRVVNEGASTTTFFRVSGVLCPIATPLPSALTEDRRLKVESTLSGRENTERHVWVNPTNEMSISPVYRMVGTNFDGSAKDPNFWTDGSLRGGTVTQGGGEIQLETNTTANGLALYRSVRKARFVAGSAQIFVGACKFVTAGTANNTRRVGAYTLNGSLNVDDGFFFQLAGTTFSIGYARAESVTLVNSGSFNGNLGDTWSPSTTSYHKMSIEFTPMGAFWYIGGKLLHKITAAHASDYMTLPITIENENTGNSTTAVVFDSVGMYIGREGELSTNQTSKFLQGISTTVCKYGAGVVKGIVITNVVDDTEVDFYDGTTTSDTLLWSSGGIKAKTDYEPIPVDFFGMPFSDGLTIDINTEICNVLVIYE